MNNNAEVLPVAYEIPENNNINNATIATVYINYEPNIEPVHIIETNHIPLRRTNNQYYNTYIIDKKYKLLFISKFLQVIIAIGLLIFLLIVLFNHYD